METPTQSETPTESAVVTESEAQAPEHDPSVPDVTLLEDKFPEWFRLRASTTGFVLLLCLTYDFFLSLIQN